MFDKQKYYKYTNDIKFQIGFTYSICTILSIIIIAILSQIIESPIISICIFILGILIANAYTKGLEIKLQEMYWQLDTYSKITNQSQKTYNILLKPSKRIISQKERRNIKQIEILDENQNLDYTVIPNYRAKDIFLSNNEIKFFDALINIVTRIRNEHHINLSIFSQVALNMIIQVNNGRNNKLWDNISARSIDFVIYDREKRKINCCIELNDETHQKEKRILRDKMIQKALNDSNIGIIFVERENGLYDENKIMNEILSFRETQ